MTVLLYVISFFLIINAIVFAHEFGHYLAAKKVGVKIITFSIGMGPELFGFTDKHGTRWCFSLLPIGGYVMMLGDGDIASSTIDEDAIESMSDEDKASSFLSKNNWEKILISISGPLANYIYAFLVMFALGMFYGLPKYPPIVGEVLKGSAAESSGFIAGDKVLSVDGKSIERYRDIVISIADSENEKLDFLVERGGQQISINVSPEIIEKKRLLFGTKKTKRIGLKSGAPVFEKLSIIDAFCRASTECISATKEMCRVFSHLFSGKKSLDDFGGIVHMASVAADLSKSGNFMLLIMLSVTLSLNLGFINLFPLPVLDGGNIFICLAEQITGRSLNKKFREYIMIACAIFLIGLMLFTAINDVLKIEAVSNFISNVLQ